MTLIRTDVRPPILLTIVKGSEIQTGTLRKIITKAGLSREAFLEAANS